MPGYSVYMNQTRNTQGNPSFTASGSSIVPGKAAPAIDCPNCSQFMCAPCATKG